jgi:3-oxoadipate CoA-transferase beta subunit
VTITTERLGTDALAALVARDIPDGSFVNLGIGQPTKVSNHLDPASGVVLHTENGMLGAFQVSARGDLANWHTGQPDAIPAVGGAMDLATGAKQTFVMMSLLTREGESKLVPECSYPLTGVGCVSRVYTDLAVFLIEERGVVVRDLFGTTFSGLQDLVAVPLIDGT